MNRDPQEVLFREEQRFGREWVWIILLTGGVPVVVIFGLGPARRIASAEVRRYSPITEFGGWGIRYGFGRGWACN